MNMSNMLRRRFLTASIAGILSLSPINKIFADESGDVEVDDHRRMPRDRMKPYIKAFVSYRLPRGQTWPAVGAVVTIQRVGAGGIVASKSTDIGGKAHFYCRDTSSTWNITAKFRGQIQNKIYKQNPNWPYINSVFDFRPLDIPSNWDLKRN